MSEPEHNVIFQENSTSLTRILLCHVPIALIVGFIIAAVLILSAWYNLRDKRRVCDRQWTTRFSLHGSAAVLEEYRQETGKYPASLEEFENDREQKQADNPDVHVAGIFTEDAWGNPFEYSVDDKGFTLKSLGRDGKPGGVGLDADLYHDDRNHKETLATFKQFFTETDPEEVHRESILPSAIVAGCVVAFVVYLPYMITEERRRETNSMVKSLLWAVILTIGAIFLGVLLLPLHIPSYH